MAKADKKFIGTFYSQRELLEKMDSLKTQGHSESDMYIVTNDTEDVRLIRGRTDADVETSKDENWIEKVKNFIMGEDPITGVFEQFGYSKEQAGRYYAEARNGGMLLFIDKDYAQKVQTDQPPAVPDRDFALAPKQPETEDFKTKVGAESATAIKPEYEDFDTVGEQTNPMNQDLKKAASGEWVDKRNVRAGDRASADIIHKNGLESDKLDHRLTKDMNPTDMTTEDSTLKKAASGEWVDKSQVHAGDKASADMINKDTFADSELDHRLTKGSQDVTTKDSTLKRAAAGEWVDQENVQAGDRASKEMVDKEKQYNKELDHRLTKENNSVPSDTSTDDSTLKKAASGEWVDKENVRAGDRIAKDAINENKRDTEELDHRLNDKQ